MRVRSFTIALLFFGISSAPLAVASATRADDATVQAMDEATQDEYHAQQTYQRVLDDFGEVRPFVNIVRAEDRHIASLSRLYERRDLDVPASTWDRDNVPTYESIEEACEGGIQNELKTIAMYDRLLELDLPGDVRAVFENLRSASSDNHLPAFRRCVEK